VRSRNLKNEEVKARYRAVKNTTTMGCDARKTNKQTFVELNLFHADQLLHADRWQVMVTAGRLTAECTYSDNTAIIFTGHIV
jgi:hypothetical protein